MKTISLDQSQTKIKILQQVITIPDVPCQRHAKEQLVSVCTQGQCREKGAICPLCQVNYHHMHLEDTWNLNYFVQQIHKQIESLQPDYKAINELLISFKLKISESIKSLILQLEIIDKQVNMILQKSKQKIDFDIDEIKTTLKNLGKTSQIDNFGKKIVKLTQYFGIDPKTHEVYRTKDYEDLQIQKMTDLIEENQQYFEKVKERITRLLTKTLDKFCNFEIPQMEMVVSKQFEPKQLRCQQVIHRAHQNWIRSVSMFKLSEREIQKVKETAQGQLSEFDQSLRYGQMAIVTTSDDMDIKVWLDSPDDHKFHLLSTITGAHQREFFGLRIHYCDINLITRLSNDISCNNLIFSAQHGLIKVWDWISKKCVNEIKTQSFFTYDFEIVKMKDLGICFAHGSKNSIQIVDFTSPFGMLMIQEINPDEQNKDISTFRKISQVKEKFDYLAVGFINGVIKVFKNDGKLLYKIQRQDTELAFCVEFFKDCVKENPKILKGSIWSFLVIGSDSGIKVRFKYYKKLVLMTYKQENLFGLTEIPILVLQEDSSSTKTILLSQSEKEGSINILDGANGQLLHSMQDALDSGLRFRGLSSYQGVLDPITPDSSIIVAGTCKGTLHIFTFQEQKQT
ncbi:unnamed protein product (macronuclear) [Paramecium tetraurelia]|uniref:Uncharacterized protein n=1 Tax=Paramecium tetraurelia TaxID=5888 RepID=A0CZ08_PARTE|nr:uncharacterized protein GSPATT00011626001 [Paramecium tetraurelia]CAK76025.1 unnamed protein product [Paramecium tetraurelia]|eukprot:XP_001443422.1 hypothetical protein (macronuclear) [Paramecium tetraurelia strain d4-2]